MDAGIAELRRMIDEAKRIVIFTGAGISTEVRHPRFPQSRRHLDEDAADRLF